MRLDGLERLAIARGLALNADQSGPGLLTHGARRLALAVLELGLLDARLPAERGPLGPTARAWLDDETTGHLYAFRALCDLFDLTPTTVRAYARARYGALPTRGTPRASVLAGRQGTWNLTRPARRTLSTITTRPCCHCGQPFTSPVRKQRACTPRCARRARRQRR